MARVYGCNPPCHRNLCMHPNGYLRGTATLRCASKHLALLETRANALPVLPRRTKAVDPERSRKSLLVPVGFFKHPHKMAYFSNPYYPEASAYTDASGQAYPEGYGYSGVTGYESQYGFDVQDEVPANQSRRGGGSDGQPPMVVPEIQERTLPAIPTTRRVPTRIRPRPRTAGPVATHPIPTMGMTTPTTSSTAHISPIVVPGSMTTPPPLLCSVGTTVAAIRPLLPPDDLCDILIFTHVRVYNSTVIAVYSRTSYETFTSVCATYKQTNCGLSFACTVSDRSGHGFLTPNMFGNSQIRSHLADLKKNSRINHYGVLDIYGNFYDVENVSTTNVPIAITGMRQILGNNTKLHKIFIGIGYYYYNDTDSWEKLAYAAETVASKDVDILVIMTTVLPIPTTFECITLPVNAHKSPNVFTPTLACQVAKAELNLEKSNIGFNTPTSATALGRTFFHSFDTIDQMKEKAMLIMEAPGRRANFSWLLLNVHLTDVTRQCLKSGPFERLKEFRKFYYAKAAQSPAG
ncbi:hypothetical protein HPB50_009925 [Hyalomma asiaticum]|uniref:Uncharacterized protein n=1 Tax=Hyalomma asiaticum TaxID=266040 RepID=A0ACB7RUB5_HYAAI|nr:hypothetical protein HPB50_009925 [Hyalomma asiaticum]